MNIWQWFYTALMVTGVILIGQNLSEILNADRWWSGVFVGMVGIIVYDAMTYFWKEFTGDYSDE